MNSIVSALTSVAHFSDEEDKRYLLSKSWNSKKPSLAIIMMCPSTASTITMDSTTLLCVNNAERLGYGSIAIVNLFATLNDFDLKDAEGEDPENLKIIVDACRAADAVVYAAGVGKAKNKAFYIFVFLQYKKSKTRLFLLVLLFFVKFILHITY